MERASHKARTLNQGQPDPEFAFPREEYQRRLQAVRENMARAGVDLLYVTMPDHICYLSGYQAAWFQEGGPKSWEGTTGICEFPMSKARPTARLRSSFASWPSRAG
jgi:hypothetical protein